MASTIGKGEEIEVRIVRPIDRSGRRPNRGAHPFANLAPAERRVKTVEILGEVWAAICIRKSREDEKNTKQTIN